MNHSFKQLAKLTFVFFLLKSEHDLVLLALVKSVFILAFLSLLIETNTQKQNSSSIACSTPRMVEASVSCTFLPVPIHPCSHMYLQLPGLSVIFHFSSTTFIEHLPHAEHRDRCWEIIVAQAHLIFHPLGFTVCRWPTASHGCHFQNILPCLFPKTSFLYCHCCWCHLCALRTSVVAMSPILLLVLTPTYPSVPWDTSHAVTWNSVKLLIPGWTLTYSFSHIFTCLFHYNYIS